MESTPLVTLIRERFEALSPQFVEVVNESYKHKHSFSESHFKVLVVSESFEDQTTIKRHRMINKLLEPELRAGTIYALSIKALTPTQFETENISHNTPACVNVK
jgi:BolA protein